MKVVLKYNKQKSDKSKRANSTKSTFIMPLKIKNSL